MACTPAADGKGQVENQVGNLRDQFFRPKAAGIEPDRSRNAWLEDQRVAYAKRHKHPEFKDRTIWEMFQQERTSLMEQGADRSTVEKAVRATTTCLDVADHNRYSVDAQGRPVGAGICTPSASWSCSTTRWWPTTRRQFRRYQINSMTPGITCLC